MTKHDPTYSQIATAGDYNRMMSREHLYIAAADQSIKRMVSRYAQINDSPSEIVEIGCGPVRLTPLLAQIPNTLVTTLDFDPGWIETAKQIVRGQKLDINLVCADIQTYQHPQPINIAVSQGSHHHIPKGKTTLQYLCNVREQLVRGGIFIVSDEMIPYYASEQERYVRLCIWYSHIIGNALKHNYEQLAVAEMETLLDDLFEGSGQRAIKDKEQMALVRSAIPTIANVSIRNELLKAEQLSEELLKGVWDTQLNANPTTAPLSRGDYKVCFSVFESEVRAAGFRIRETKTIGPTETIGGFGIYVLDVQV